MNIQGITPSNVAPQQAQTVAAPRATTNASSNTSPTSSGLLGGSSSNLQDTFLSLLVTELQNQDPTTPVDPAQMVGQMVSLNQLNQLIAMNQTLSSMADGSISSASASASSGVTGNLRPASTVATNAPAAQTSGAAIGTPQPTYSAVDPNSIMNLYGSGNGSNTSFITSGVK